MSREKRLVNDRRAVLRQLIKDLEKKQLNTLPDSSVRRVFQDRLTEAQRELQKLN